MPEVRIRPLERNDAKTSYVWRNDPDIWKLTGSRPSRIITLQDEQSWINQVMADNTCRRFAILADETYVGNTYLTGINNRTAEFHIFIGDKEYWGKGIASEASKLIIDFGRSELRLSSIYLKVHEDNGAAIHVYEKMGFIQSGKEGIFNVMRLELDRSNEEK
ncbi:GNAT family N-acetyltransferase [Candidatus Saccharibacteria bacterium]|nr:GNAT family N-acetyltransferase [Candidatus Saccharibacteria bacterium]